MSGINHAADVSENHVMFLYVCYRGIPVCSVFPGFRPREISIRLESPDSGSFPCGINVNDEILLFANRITNPRVANRFCEAASCATFSTIIEIKQSSNFPHSSQLPLPSHSKLVDWSCEMAISWRACWICSKRRSPRRTTSSSRFAAIWFSCFNLARLEAWKKVP